MEHHLLADLAPAGRENVVHTYISLARGLPGTEVLARDGYVRVTGSQPLSFCHFAGCFESDRDPRELAAELRQEARGPDGLWVFLLPGDQPDGLRAALLENGFSLRQCLCQFGRYGRGRLSDGLYEAHDADSRLRVSQFMAEQFFPFTPGESRMLVARSTATSLANLFYMGVGGSPQAAMMLSKSEKSVGLYNLCVEGQMRGQGLGTALVESAQALADKYGLPLTLQCHASLRKWYEGQGFRQTGTLNAFFCGPGRRSDIL